MIVVVVKILGIVAYIICLAQVNGLGVCASVVDSATQGNGGRCVGFQHQVLCHVEHEGIGRSVVFLGIEEFAVHVVLVIAVCVIGAYV